MDVRCPARRRLLPSCTLAIWSRVDPSAIVRSATWPRERSAARASLRMGAAAAAAAVHGCEREREASRDRVRGQNRMNADTGVQQSVWVRTGLRCWAKKLDGLPGQSVEVGRGAGSQAEGGWRCRTSVSSGVRCASDENRSRADNIG